MNSLLSFSIAYKINLSGLISILNIYCLMKTWTKSFYFFFHSIDQPHIPSKGRVTLTVLKEVNQQFLILAHLSHFVAVYLEMSYRALSSCIFDEFRHLKFLEIITLDTKHISAAFVWSSCRLVPSNALILCSRAANLSKPSIFYYHLILLKFLHYKVNGRWCSYRILWLSNLGIRNRLRFKWPFIFP